MKKGMRLLVRSMFILAIVLTACSKDESTKPGTEELSAEFAVISDVHYYEPTLGTTGADYQAYLAQDRKLITESSEIAKAAIQILAASEAEFVLIPGDLTKDGARISHEALATLLQQLIAAGKKVYVVPGNHDVNNPHALSYQSDTATPVENVSPEMFATIYAEFGYDDAIARDENSLSYVVEPKDGLWLVCMDACLYQDNLSLGRPVTGGKFNPATLDWVLEQVAKGRAEGKQVLGMMHHGIAEHFIGQKTFFADYVIEDYTSVAEEFATAGMHVVFTGHFHSQDIVKAGNGDKFVYDVETGSLVTAPCPYRMVSLQDNAMRVHSGFVEDINYNTNGVPFQQYALNYLTAGLPNVIMQMLVYQFGASQQDAALATPLMTGAMVAHYFGDEVMPAEVKPYVDAFMADSDPLKKMLGGALTMIYMDPLPSDNSVEINMNTGAIIQLF